MEFRHAAVAGTFDRFHRGHHTLLDKAFAVAKQVSVGITVDQLTSYKVLAKLISPYKEREAAVVAYLNNRGYMGRYNVFPLSDRFGPAVTDTTLDALVVSTQTKEGAEAVNQKRHERGMEPLATIVADYVPSLDGLYLSSTRIRLGEIDREGFVYKSFLLMHAPFIPDENLRDTLHYPLGDIIEGSEKDIGIAAQKAIPIAVNSVLTYVVGDVVMESFLSKGITPSVGIFDNRNKRKAFEHTFNLAKDSTSYSFINEPGMISSQACGALAAMQDTINHDVNFDSPGMRTIEVTGEEDLLVLPLILLAPLQSTIFYGQSDKGIVMITVTEEQKAKTLRMLQSTSER